MVPKLTFKLLMTLNFILLTSSCNYIHKNKIKESKEIDILQEQILKIYRDKILDEDILMIAVKDSLILTSISLKSAPHRTNVSLCFTDDSRYYIDYDRYESFSKLIQELKDRIANGTKE